MSLFSSFIDWITGQSEDSRGVEDLDVGKVAHSNVAWTTFTYTLIFASFFNEISRWLPVDSPYVLSQFGGYMVLIVPSLLLATILTRQWLYGFDRYAATRESVDSVPAKEPAWLGIRMITVLSLVTKVFFDVFVIPYDIHYVIGALAIVTLGFLLKDAELYRKLAQSLKVTPMENTKHKQSADKPRLTKQALIVSSIAFLAFFYGQGAITFYQWDWFMSPAHQPQLITFALTAFAMASIGAFVLRHRDSSFLCVMTYIYASVTMISISNAFQYLFSIGLIDPAIQQSVLHFLMLSSWHIPVVLLGWFTVTYYCKRNLEYMYKVKDLNHTTGQWILLYVLAVPLYLVSSACMVLAVSAKMAVKRPVISLCMFMAASLLAVSYLKVDINWHLQWGHIGFDWNSVPNLTLHIMVFGFTALLAWCMHHTWNFSWHAAHKVVIGHDSNVTHDIDEDHAYAVAPSDDFSYVDYVTEDFERTAQKIVDLDTEVLTASKAA